MVIGTKGDNSVGKSFDLRNPYDDGICLDFLGSPGWPRFAIQDERKKLFWTGTGWTSDRKKAHSVRRFGDGPGAHLGIKAGHHLGLARGCFVSQRSVSDN